jgi:hypothetical protein
LQRHQCGYRRGRFTRNNARAEAREDKIRLSTRMVG